DPDPRQSLDLGTLEWLKQNPWLPPGSIAFRDPALRPHNPRLHPPKLRHQKTTPAESVERRSYQGLGARGPRRSRRSEAAGLRPALPRRIPPVLLARHPAPLTFVAFATPTLKTPGRQNSGLP